MLERLGSSISTLFKGVGCTACDGHGYKGRIGIFELLIIDSGLRALIMRDPSRDVLYKHAYAQGFRSLMHDGLEKVEQGIITLQELVRVA